jgi:tetratricopeptide (TPR) repeat protein
MKILGIILSVLFSSMIGFSQENWNQANNYYDDQEYEQAINLYESLISEGYQSFDLYYNVGNSYYKLDMFAEAVLFYEKSLLLEPGNEDAQHNLEKVNQKIKDKSELSTKYDSAYLRKELSNYIHPYAFQVLSILILVFFIVFLVFRKLNKKNTRPVWLIIALIISASIFLFSKWQENQLLQYSEGIIFSPRVNVKSSPNIEGTGIFILHEGTKIRILNEENSWSRVYLDSEKIGWIESSKIRKI